LPIDDLACDHVQRSYYPEVDVLVITQIGQRLKVPLSLISAGQGRLTVIGELILVEEDVPFRLIPGAQEATLDQSQFLLITLIRAMDVTASPLVMNTQPGQ